MENKDFLQCLRKDFLKTNLTPQITNPILKDPDFKSYLLLSLLSINLRMILYFYAKHVLILDFFQEFVIPVPLTSIFVFYVTISEKEKSLSSKYCILNMHENQVGS